MKKVMMIMTIDGSIKPEDRGKIQEKLDEDLQKAKIGEVTGGGTYLNLETHTIIGCAIDIDLNDIKYLDQLICILRDYNIKEKYTLEYNDNVLEFNQ